MKKTRLGIAAVITALALALTGCSGGGGNAASTDGGKTKAPDTLSIGTVIDKTGWEIGQGGTAFNAIFFSAAYDSLVLVDENGKPYGQLAKSIDTSSDGLTYTFHLVSGVKFDDGTTFDADTAVANLEYLKKAPMTSTVYANVAGISKVDDSTVAIKMTRPDPAFLYSLGLGGSYMVSAKALSNPKYAQETTPVGGSGPYTFDASKSTAGQDYYFTRNDSAWNAKRYPWKNLQIHVIADATAMSNAMSTGAINFEMANYSDELKATVAQNGWTINHVMNGWSGLMLADRTGAKFKPLGSLKVRQAINMAFDRASIAKASKDPATVVTNQVFADVDSSLNKVDSFNVKKAKQLLSEAGYPNGFTLDLPSMSLFSATAATVKQSLGDIGIKVNVVNLDPATYNQQVFAGNYPVYMAFLQLYASPAMTIGQYFQPGMSNPFNSTQGVPELQSLDTQLHSANADVDKIAGEYNSYAVDNAWFAVWNHGATYYVSVPGISVRPVQGLYIPNLEQFLPKDK
ncbi:ABC transporter substrate-binding protein [Humibacter ginsenosidimutans]|uniref:Solute-binding protein family 5 domain-containing protein n=1 Tax=Humibacter ginsenosidimutans TaxID=2599293 RepID=A0A5B8M2Q5_9MICO|nr:ABC transporter substrate-binding protein [Humibacter ginsenosidimutans]QDZ14633.1 hypothetical protein FPZ11_07580 [Humibacter ginsenosidimutans]